MPGITSKHFDDIPYYQGPHALPGIRFHAAGKAYTPR